MKRADRRLFAWGSVRLAVVLLVLGTLPARAGDPPGLVFANVTETTGVGLTEQLTESAAWGDYDGDGDQDLYLSVNGGNKLFRNDGGDVFIDVTDATGVGNGGFSVGAAFGDLDNDGDLELYVVNFQAGLDVLYRNDGPIGKEGETVFTDIGFDAGITLDRSSRGMAFVDYDRDGLLDIYVNAIGADILYRNLGDLAFQDVASSVGIVNINGLGVGVVATDIDDDGWIDLFTGNRSGDPNRLFANDGGSFTDITASAGIDKVGLGMGVLSFDYDNDLDFDLYWTSWPEAPNALYRNDGPTGQQEALVFTDVASASGTLDANGWGISCNAGDVDNDGWMDFYVTNGFGDTTTPNVLFRNTGLGIFEDVTDAVGGGAFDGRGVAFSDYDNDGDLDFIVTADASEPNQLWRNDTDNGNHWVVFELVGTDGNPSAIGARIEVETALGTTAQEVSGGAGRGSFNSLPVEFGLGSADAIDAVHIRWPNGDSQTLEELAIDRYHEIVQVPEPTAVALCAASLTTLALAQRRRRRATGARGSEPASHPARTGVARRRVPRRLVINEEGAPIVRRIFTELVEGESLRGIAHQLNGEGIASPRGKGWAVSAIRSLVLNLIYRGEYIWNRSEWIKDHETGRRRKIARPENEWLRQEDSAWAVVEPGLWQAAQDELARRGGRHPRGAAGRFKGAEKGQPGRRSKRLLSGFLRCGVCEGAFHVRNNHSGYGCGWRRDRGPAVCSNELVVTAEELEQRFLGVVQDEILTDTAAEYVLERALDIIERRRDPNQDRAAALGRRLVEFERELENLVELVAQTGDVEVCAKRIREGEAERQVLVAALVELETPPPDPKALRGAIEARLRDLRGWFGGAGESARRALRMLLGQRRLEVHPDEEHGWRVEGFFELALNAGTARVHEDTGPFVSVVAGTRHNRLHTVGHPLTVKMHFSS